ncbi:hypothetical protein JMN32_11145 [Fulvivirga sp. 29W222]|uniref:SGNH/GDSL hydrolase family protein n=1 Tax=Fulvivirga marina TaxID=2494733 RepID=A0A937FYL6_9BACT|nr:hypothetical protein [Fulvivirga marina]MBL6446871.1 hypothetical protein [Fulvivirga marina]
MSKRKLFIVRVLLFSAICFVVLLSISSFLKIGHKYVDRRPNIKLYRVFDRADINAQLLILGSSIAEAAFNSGIIEEQTGLKTYNAALSGRKIQDWRPVGYQLCHADTVPDIVILDVFPNMLDWYGNIYHPQDFYPYLLNPNVKEALSEINSRYSKLVTVPFYELTMLNSNYIKDAFQAWVTGLEQQGYDSLEFVQTEGSDFDPKDLQHFIPVAADPLSVKAYYELISCFNQRGTRVIFIAPPMYSPGMSAYVRYGEVKQMVNQIADSTNSLFLDYSNLESFSEKKLYFFNNTHLNGEGAAAFSRRFSLDIKPLTN